MFFDQDYDLYSLQRIVIGYYLKGDFFCQYRRRRKKKEEEKKEIIEYCIIYYFRINENRRGLEQKMIFQ